MIRHHPSDATLLAYAAGSMPEALALAVATHLGTCSVCRHTTRVLNATGGVILDDLPPEPLASDALHRVLTGLDRQSVEPIGVVNPDLPPPLDRVVLGRWWLLGAGIRWRPIRTGGPAWAGLIRVHPGRRLLRHGHTGLELTCVISGAFRDGTGEYYPGDLAEAEGEHEPPPIALGWEPCVCLIASQGIRLRGVLGFAQRVAGYA